MSLESRVEKIEDAIEIMKNLLVSHDERLENYFNALNRERQEREESRRDFEFKLNALIDAQIRNQDEMNDAQRSIEIYFEKSGKFRKSVTENAFAKNLL